MPAQITMPQLSDTMTEGTVVKWHKKEGDKVRAGEEIVEIETDKATMPFEASESGSIAHVAVGEGQKVPVGALIAVLATSKENPADVKKSVAARSGGTSKAAAARGDGTGGATLAPAAGGATRRGASPGAPAARQGRAPPRGGGDA